MQNEFKIQPVLDAVKKVGDLFLSEFKGQEIPQEKKVFMAQLNEIEARCLASLQKDLAADFSETPWLGEEFNYAEQQQPINLPEYWLCDTMDGAIQYMQHLSGWTINLALIRDGRPHLAVIYDPVQNEMFWAHEGHGAYMNDKRIKPSGKSDARLMVATFNHSPFSNEIPGLNQKTGTLVKQLLEYFGAVRNYGPHGLQLASLGAGRIDVFYQEGLDTYNWLAGILIAQEAGAEILNSDGDAWKWGDESLLVTAPGVGKLFLQKKHESAFS